jgi:O-antigen ligase
MTGKLFTEDRLTKGYYSYLVAVITVIILAVHVQYLPPCMVLWCLVWLLENRLRFKDIWQNNRYFSTLCILFGIYYLWQLLSLTYTNDVKLGMNNLFGRLSLLLFPLVLFYPGETIKSRAKILLKIFAISTFLFILFCFCHALLRSVYMLNGHWTFDPHPQGQSWLNYFFGSDLTSSQHPSYVAMYVVLAFFICFESWLDFTTVFSKRIWWMIIGFFLLITQYFLSSRAGILTSMLMVPFYFIIKLRRSDRGRYVWIGIIVIVILLVPVVLNNQRVDYLSRSMSKQKSGYIAKKDPRLIIWDSALQIAKNHLLLGVGIGDVRTELTLEYKRIGENKMAGEQLNAHNQFLEVLVENGIIGVILILSIFIYMAWIAYTGKNLIYGLFIMIVFIFFQFESMLYRFAGVSFFSLFSFLLMHITAQTGNKELAGEDKKD